MVTVNGKNGITIERIQSRIPAGVLIYIPKGEKGPKHKKWEKTTFAATQFPTYQKMLRDYSNTGVLLGEPSGNLVALDFDLDSDVQSFLNDNPRFEKTLRTRGARGCQFWFFLTGNYPRQCISIEDRGEWRGGGCQSVLRGLHPTGCYYTWLVDAEPITLAFSEIVLPDWLLVAVEQEKPRPKHTNPGAAPNHGDNSVARFLKERTLEACQHYLINGFERKGEWWLGDRDGNAGDSASIALYGENAGVAFDFNGRRPGLILEVIAKALGLSVTEAAKQIKKDFSLGAPSLEQGDNEPPLSRKLKEEDTEQKIFDELLRNYSAAVRTSGELETVSLPPRKKLLGQWLYEGDLGFVYGERGSGKTWFIDAVATYLSIGMELQGWKVPEAADVLLVDGEMPIDAARDRLKGMRQGNGRLHLLHHDMLFNVAGLAMNLTSELTQKVITAICIDKKIKLLILDNLSCLFSGVKENDADEWEKVLRWLLDLRRRRIAVLIVHHAGVSGRMRGTTRREDAAFWVIQVDELKNRQENETGASFHTVFTKQRNSDSREWAREWTFKTAPDGQISIGCNEISFDAKVLGLIEDGLSSATDIATELGVHKSTVCRAAQRLVDANLIELNRKAYRPRGFTK
jgi:DNA-binding transcriptional ArsR family regulator